MAKIERNITSSKRFRHFDVVLYCSLEELKSKLLEYSSRIVRYAFILHDHDLYSDDILSDDGETVLHKKGELKKPHFHLIVSFYNNCTLMACKRVFTTLNDNPRVISIGDMQLAYEYLIHKNDPDKYQYNKCDIVSDDINFYEKLCINGCKEETDNKAEKIVMDLIAGVSTRIMVARYGRDFIIHRSQYAECADIIKNEDLRDKYKREEEERFKKYQLELLSRPEQIKFDFDKKKGV